MQKKYKKYLNAATLALLLAILSLLFLSGIEFRKILLSSDEKNKVQMKFCKPLEKGYGSMRSSKIQAQLSAISSWSRNASRYGKEYSFWNNSNEKKMKCNRYIGSLATSCYASARPCVNNYNYFENNKKFEIN